MNMSLPTISIIVPVYNAAASIEACVRSIRQQSFSDWELLLVNDGSTDNTLSIITELAKSESRIVIIDKEHSGVSDTRNLALDKMRGEYVCFVDADDTVDVDYLSSLYEKREYDMVICGYTVDDYTKTRVLLRSTQYKPESLRIKHLSKNRESIKSLFLNGMININCNKLLRTAVIRKHHLKYTSIPINEDFYFMLDYLNVADSICTISNASYHWIRIKCCKTGINTLQDNLLEIYTQSHQKIISFFHNESLAHEAMYHTYYFVVLKYCEAITKKEINIKVGLQILKRIMRDKYVMASFNTRNHISKGERLMNFLLRHRLFVLFIAFNRYLKTL